MKNKLFALLLPVLIFPVSMLFSQQNYFLETDIPYRVDDYDQYINERCRLDIYFPAEGNFKTILWFHGGGLVEGEKSIPNELKEKGICVVAPNYRLSPRARHPEYIYDAAAAVCWVLENIEQYGGDPSQVYVGGHSAGGYLSLMIALNYRIMEEFGYRADNVRGWYPVSGQTITHYTIRRELGLPENIPYIDDYAPLRFVRDDTPPILLITGSTRLEMACRAVENRYLYEALKYVGNENVNFHELSGFDHGTVLGPAFQLIVEDMQKR